MATFVPLGVEVRAGGHTPLVPRRRAGFQSLLAMAAGVPDPRTEQHEGASAGTQSAEQPPAVDVEALLEQAREGVRQELEAELAEAREQLAQESEGLQQLVQDVEEQRLRWVSEAREGSVAFLRAALVQLLGGLPEAQDRFLVERIGLVAEQLSSARELELRVRPDQVDRARELVGVREGWSVVAAPELEGGCVAATAGGRVDASLEIAMDGIDRALEAWQDEQRGREVA